MSVLLYLSPLQISYASSSPALSDRNKYKSFFRNTFNMQIMAPALRSAVAYFNWTRIAILTQNEGLFTGVNNNTSYFSIVVCMYSMTGIYYAVNFK